MKTTAKLLLPVLVLMLSTSISIGQNSQMQYIETLEDFANPERGWYDHYSSHGGSSNLGTQYVSLKADRMTTFRESYHITLVLRMFLLHQFLEEDAVSSEYLALMQADFDSIRAAGVKCIIRFAYSASQSAEVWDATPNKVFSHIESLGAVLQANGDLIAGVQAGFIGAWGEWYYTKNFAGQGYVPDENDQQNRRMLVEKLLDKLPPNVSVQGRTPAIMQNIVGTMDPISEEEAFNGSYKSRTGHHNDCFLASASDYGTYTNLTEDLAYLHESTKYTITGGETCDDSNSYSDCVNGVPRMEELHWTYLNRGYHKGVYDKWKEQGCFDEINLALGYRVHLEEALLPDAALPGNEINLDFNFVNRGYAAPTQDKQMQLILTHSLTGESSRHDILAENADIRFWLPGDIQVHGSVNIPSDLPEGTYAMALSFADQNPALSNNPAYSIRLANAGCWDAENGSNILNHLLSIGTSGEGSLPDSPTMLAGSATGEHEILLSWQDNSDNESGFELMRARDENEIWESVTILDADTESYTDGSLDKGIHYQYMIRAINSLGASSFSNDVSIPTLGVDVNYLVEDGIGMYPNPLSEGELIISSPGSEEKQVLITDLRGKKVFEILGKGKDIHINHSEFTPGIYVVSLIRGDKINSRTLVVQ